MGELLKTYMDEVRVISNVPLQLPKLKKLNNGTTNTPKIKLPKLKTIDG